MHCTVYISTGHKWVKIEGRAIENVCLVSIKSIELNKIHAPEHQSVFSTSCKLYIFVWEWSELFVNTSYTIQFDTPGIRLSRRNQAWDEAIFHFYVIQNCRRVANNYNKAKESNNVRNIQSDVFEHEVNFKRMQCKQALSKLQTANEQLSRPCV